MNTYRTIGERYRSTPVQNHEIITHIADNMLSQPENSHLTRRVALQRAQAAVNGNRKRFVLVSGSRWPTVMASTNNKLMARFNEWRFRFYHPSTFTAR